MHDRAGAANLVGSGNNNKQQTNKKSHNKELQKDETHNIPSTAKEMRAAAKIRSGKNPVNCRTNKAMGDTLGVGMTFLPCCSKARSTSAVVKPDNKVELVDDDDGAVSGSVMLMRGGCAYLSVQ